MLIYYKYAYTGESAGWLGEFHEAGSFRKKKITSSRDDFQRRNETGSTGHLRWHFWVV